MFFKLGPTFTLFLLTSSPWKTACLAGYVMPMIGGGQIGMMGAPMKHVDVVFDGTQVGVHVDETVATPLLRRLTSPDQFDPTAAWAVLQEKNYNFQYGWNTGGFIALPPNTGIWIAQIDASEELKTYQRPPASPSYAPVFGTDGSASIWKWSGSMTHNVYAVSNPRQSFYFADYKVYIGDVTTGTEIVDETGNPLYMSQLVGIQFEAIPLLPADFNLDNHVDPADLAILGGHWLQPGDFRSGDATNDQFVDPADFAILSGNWLLSVGGVAEDITTAAEPSTIALLTVGLLGLGGNRRRRKAQCLSPKQ